MKRKATITQTTFTLLQKDWLEPQNTVGQQDKTSKTTPATKDETMKNYLNLL